MRELNNNLKLSVSISGHEFDDFFEHKIRFDEDPLVDVDQQKHANRIENCGYV